MQDISYELIKKASEGDFEAFEAIFRKTSAYVYTLAFRITGNKEDAEDVTQDVFVSIYKNFGNFHFDSSFKTWIYRITTNMAINSYRKASKKRKRIVELNENMDIDDFEGKKDKTFDKEHNEMLVRSMLEKLPQDQKTCIVLREIEGLSYQEISEVLKIKMNTVRSRLKRAREKLIFLYGKRRSYEM